MTSSPHETEGSKRWNQSTSDLAKIPAGAAFGMGASEPDPATERAIVDAEPIDVPTLLNVARRPPDGVAGEKPDPHTSDKLSARVAVLSPPQPSETGRAGDRWFADDPPRVSSDPDTPVETEIPATIARAPFKPVKAPVGDKDGALDRLPRRQLALNDW